ncbi:hypothetical protein M3P05_18300 [Sansalvadorimonas sp. 2012CJ34-2]|uniref:Uncharacterized protein n=1 Tax=Parendozoicomonas callyspongiae TaxID=2942213 RepID=A0ABT0PN22_9GAMM|nr:hypothetical protein [Sansalvadorimonas sp. 2012CJ34-2]MCL6271873.1 hypothetical protein [Sansalvadorimonas sp. 2012CJ34-2]
MSQHKTHSHPEHVHGEGCGHTAIRHNGHIDYIHDGHLHHPNKDYYEEHVIDVSDTNPDGCSPVHSCSDSGHIHGSRCGHEKVPHGDHFDYLVDGRLHHVHDGHCDDHGKIEVI